MAPTSSRLQGMSSFAKRFEGRIGTVGADGQIRKDGGGVRGHVDGHRLLAGLAVAARAPDDGRDLMTG